MSPSPKRYLPPIPVNPDGRIMSKTIIISDLDGTLLDPATYSFETALPALRQIRDRGIPLVLCSSKTRAEVEVYRKRLENVDPFISENGGGIFIPEGYFPFSTGYKKMDGYEVAFLGRAYSDVRKSFLALRTMMGVRAKGFGDMTAEEIARLTSLPLEEAKLAAMRDFDEPFLFEKGEEAAPFLKAIEDSGFRWTQGAFFHILGDHDKGRGVRILKEFYEKAWGEIRTIGLGDSLNDLPFLQEVDVPILVQRRDGTYDPRIALPNLVGGAGIGPAGWNRAILNRMGSR
jgi:mannosyl-3-phosphoglycerate phosphatase